MPRYFITTTNHVTITDEEGTEVADVPALRTLLRQALAEILRDEGERTGANAFSADAYDEGGRLVMSARVNLTISQP